MTCYLAKESAHDLLDVVVLSSWVAYWDFRDVPSFLCLEQATRLEIVVASSDLCIMLRLVAALSLCLNVVYGLEGPNTTGKICQWGCWDEEDEACHPGLNAAGLKREDTFFFFVFFQRPPVGWKHRNPMIVCLQCLVCPHIPFLKRLNRTRKSSTFYLKSTRFLYTYYQRIDSPFDMMIT